MSDTNAQSYPQEHRVTIEADQTGSYPVSVAPAAPINIVPPSNGSQKTQPDPILNHLQNMAQGQAIQDINLRLAPIIRAGHTILLDREFLDWHIETLASKDISSEHLREKTYDELLKVYKTTYQTTFDDRKLPFSDSITELTDEKEKRLRDLLERERFKVSSRVPGDGHARDLVVMHVLQVYDVTNSTTLFAHHKLIDRYERFVLADPERNEVRWPDQNSFRL